MNRLFLLLFSLCSLGSSIKAIDFWQTFNLTEYDSDTFQTRTHAQLRYADTSFLSYYRISQKFYYKVNKNLNFGIHPVYTDRRSSPGSDWRTNYRLDLESNHTFKFDDITLKIRNRYEIRQRVGSGSAFDRFRINANIRIPLDLLPYLQAVTIGNEVFWNVEDSFINENRFTPLALNFSVHGTSWSPSIMYISRRSSTSSDWQGDYILGLSGSFKF